jgi:uncharacterized protein YacL (UPF0231 family)
MTILKNILKWIWFVIKYGFCTLFVTYLIVTPIKLQKQLDAIQGQQDDIYTNQAQVFQELSDVTKQQVLIDELLAKSVTDTQADLDKKAEALSKLIISAENRSVKRDVIIAEAFQEEIKKPTYEYLSNITVLIMANQKDDPKQGWIGTGTILKIDGNKTYILTNHHVMNNDTDTMNYYVVNGKKKIPLINIRCSKTEGVDLSLNYINEAIPGKEAVKGLAIAKPQDHVYMVGHNLGRPFLYAEGWMAGYDPRNNYEIIMDIPSGPGNSGSGLIDKNGNLVGLLYAGSIIPLPGFETVGAMDTSHGLCMRAEVIALFIAGEI